MKDKMEKLTEAGREVIGAAVNKGKDVLDAGIEAGKPVAVRIKNAGEDLLEPVSGGLRNAGATLLSQRERIRAHAAELIDEQEKKHEWSGAGSIRTGSAPDTVVPGCLVLEGGSFRGVYTSGVLDVLMENGINLQTVIGTSAGALNGYNYMAGEIGRSARINLCYRHDRRFFGAKAAVQNRGVVGFNFILDDIEEDIPFDEKRFWRTDRRFVVNATNCETGETVYLEKGVCSDIVKAVRASASMPLVSEPVELDGMKLLDGGCSVKMCYQWALDEGFDKILVVRTRVRDYVRQAEGKAFQELAHSVYSDYPQLVERLCTQADIYNSEAEELRTLDAERRIMMLCPSGSINVGTLEGDMEKLGALYLLGRRDTEYMLPQIRAYLGID